MDFSQALLNKIDAIIDKWIDGVRQDSQIESAKALPYQSLRDGIPVVLKAISTVLSPSTDSDIKTLIQKSLEHGTLRAQQGYDAEEIAREYRLLRWAIFSSLEEDLLQGSPANVFRAMRSIDTALDEVIALCFKTYTQERLQELEELQNQLRLTNQELTRLIRASQENISQLAHELKTPLTSIIGYSDLFLRQQRQNSVVTESSPNLGHIDRVLRNGRQLLRLINDALEFSRYEAGKMKVQLAPIDLRSVINSVIEMVELLARSKELTITIECDRAPDKVITDSLRLQQIITNLLSNAIRYTEAGCIKVECEALPDNQWFIAVTDTGIGIDPDAQKRIFEPYFQASTGDRSFVPNSTGLGLAIVSRLVKLLQGKIELVSQVGVGSTFKVIFPIEVQLSDELVNEA